MQGLEQLKDAMTDLHRRKEAMREQMQAFEALQDEIAALRARAARDPDARRKLQRLDDLMKHGGQGLAERMTEQAGKTEQCLKRLGDEIAQLALAAAPQPEASRERRTPRKFARAFV
ncbi:MULTISPECIES: hypothetical protein [Burkholderia]|uniref:Uncharacterized protein n=1 Tax=Burkholderia savannae TaxID=1637837 RepID=A0ABR5T522_9BURK|nr:MULTISPECIES: hypothetical protein [Burkholderia]AOJ71473.1 hypothetical protein WS78_21865 [Burkholderia savannae]AOJ83901.1 hypothetical protein WS86_25140 [Burkholderia savannae]AOK49866.1 hypothetical protein WT60_23660 [Burkholderia sp. MSMB617WGS]KGS06297.1 hypothetical protein X946_5941 [Burkholderia sp. ABCPW 111]KVG37136.1 hypothetical protein WS77_23125 [Burkholderia sp. MSMB0265]